ncbi:MAG TPA: penicillin acylase family protein [Nocardioidaceae bacterium]|nr:penicillin acylase family protein [Nocardioidaceae bacterium]
MRAFEVFRDTYGIPHIRAGSVEDLAFGQGHTAAADRSWQLDLERVRGEGRVAELVGAPGIEWDVFARRALIEPTAQRAFANLSPETQAFVTAYVEGVNAGLSPAPEHEELDARPGTWQPWTPLTVFLVQHVLFATYPQKLWRHHVHRHLGDEGLSWFRQEGMPLSGSNAFAVGGGRTASGRPLVAGDPHRLFEAPNVYAQVHLACPEFDVAGFTFPGVPGVQHFAHAGSVAWAITNAMADYQDLYVEELDGTEERRTELVEVRGGESVRVEVVVTPRGPVVVDGEETFSLRTASYVGEDLGFEALLPLLRARTVGDVDAAFAHWVEPVNNVVIADSTGTVLHRVAGKVPVRPLENRRLPVPASDDWVGWAELPRTPVGTDGVVVSANQRMSDDFDRIGDDFACPDRADRITELLGDRRGLTVDDLAAILTDTHSYAAGGDLRQVGARYIGARDALVARIGARAAFDPLRGGSPYGSIYDPWFHLLYRISRALPRGPELSDELSDELGDEVDEGWPHRFHPLHGLEQLGVESALVDALHAATAVPLVGDNDCVQAMHTVPGVPVCSRGPVARYVWDLADRDNSRWVVPLGASGVPGEHSHDQLALWAEGRLVPVVTDWERLEEEGT